MVMALRVYDTNTDFKKSDGIETSSSVTKGNLMKRNKLMGVKLILWYTKFRLLLRFIEEDWNGCLEFQSAVLP
jgi:hypothetical protein